MCWSGDKSRSTLSMLTKEIWAELIQDLCLGAERGGSRSLVSKGDKLREGGIPSKGLGGGCTGVLGYFFA